MRGRRLAPFLVGVIAVASACSSRSGAIDTKRLEREILHGLAREVPGFRVNSVRCPAHVNRGDSFHCTAAIDGLHRTYRAHASHSGKLSFAPIDAVIVTAQANAFVAQTVASGSGGGSVRADCGSSGLMVLRPGQTFACTAAGADGQQLALTLEVKDVNGTIEVTSG